MWEATGYGAQKDQMKKAGLNPGLLYGMSGGGGQTANIEAQAAQGAQAPAGGREIQDIMGMGIQRALAQSTIELNKSQANKNNADAAATSGYKQDEVRANIASLTQGIENAKALEQVTKAEKALKDMELFEKGASQSDRMDQITYDAETARNHMLIAQNEADISKETMDSKIKIIQLSAIEAALRNALTEEQTGNVQTDTKLKEEQIKKISQEIAQDWAEIGLKSSELSLKKWVEEVKANFPSMSEAAGRLLNDALESIHKLGVYKNRQNHYNTRKKM